MTDSVYRTALRTTPGRSLRMLLLIATLLMPIGHATAQWTADAPEGIASYMSFSTMHFVNDRIGFALGSMPGAGLLFKTTDGGRSWHPQQTTDMLWFGLTSSDSMTIYITGYLNSCGCAVVVRSTNQGKTWTQGTYSGSFGFYDIKFATPTTGFTGGYGGVILKTDDNGEHWDPVRTGTDDDVFTLLAFPSADTGYAVAGDSGRFYIPDRLYRTTNGGNDWEMVQNYEQTTYISDIAFTTPTTGYMVGNKDRNEAIMKTTDAGTTWKQVYTGRGQLVLYGLTFIDPNVGYVVGDTGRILRTTDAGETWNEEISNSTAALLDVVAVGTDIFAVGLDGAFLKRSAISAVADRQATERGEAVTILPNPFDNSATVVPNGLHPGTNYTFILSDLLGRDVRQIVVSGGTHSFPLTRDELPDGMYFYRLVSEEGTVSTGRITIR